MEREGYAARYIADITFSKSHNSAGFIMVSIAENTQTKAHAHQILEEIFIILNRTRMGVGKQMLDLEAGDIVIVEPSELHWFETPKKNGVQVVAIKVPNFKDDKVPGY